MRRFFAKFATLLRRDTAERELSREIESHLALLQEDFERQGLSPAAAKLAARKSYGGIEQAKELHREERSHLWLEHFFKDLRYGARNLWRSPGFTAVAVMALALGIGANTAIFGVVNSVLLRPLAYKDPERLVTILHYGSGPVATANYFDWRDQTHSFTAMGAADFWSPNLTNTDKPEHLYGLKVTQNLLPLLGVDPLMGRLFAPGEDQTGADHEVILSHALWVRLFNADRNVIGKPVTLDGEVYTIVGVMPPKFKFAPYWAIHAELWVPDALEATAHQRGGNHLRVFARLKPGVTFAQAQADMSTVSGRLDKEFPATNRGVTVIPLMQKVVGNIETPLLLMLGAVGFVLLIACANVAHMLLARTADRQKEIAVRVALGAGRARVISQFLTESLLLAALGALVGWLLALAGTKALVFLAPAYIPRVETITIDTHALLFLLGVTVVTALAFGLIPAVHAAATNLNDSLKEGGRGDSDGISRNRLRTFLVASEFALAFVLLIGAGLMIRSFHALQLIDPGFNPHNVLSMVVSVAGTKEADSNHRPAFYRELLEKVRHVPSVVSVGAINHLPLEGDQWDRSFLIEGRPDPRAGQEPDAVYRLVMPGYFETMRLPLRRGRLIDERDDARAPGVVVINERAAHAYWPNENPIGKRIYLKEQDQAQRNWLTVIGVVADARQIDWDADPSEEMYLPALQTPDFLGQTTSTIAPHMSYLTLVVRGSGDAKDLTSAVEATVHSIDPNVPISQVITMDGAIAKATAQPRFEMLLLGLFSAVALLLAAIGIYGVMNYSISRRTREIGIRMSLGASRRDVLRMVLRQAILQAIVGTAVGVVASLLLVRLLTKLLYGIQPTDPLTFASVIVVLGAAALIAALIPARKAMHIEPLLALRSE